MAKVAYATESQGGYEIKSWKKMFMEERLNCSWRINGFDGKEEDSGHSGGRIR